MSDTAVVAFLAAVIVVAVGLVVAQTFGWLL